MTSVRWHVSPLPCPLVDMLLNSLFMGCLASIAAFRIGPSVVSFCPLLWWLASYWSSSLWSGLTGVSPCSAHSGGYKKLSVRFGNFPEAVRTVAALISKSVLKISSSATANFQVPRGELSFRTITSPLVGCVEDCVLGAFYYFCVRSRKLSTYPSNYSFQNMSRCFWSLRHMSRSFCEGLNTLRKSGSCSRSSSAKDDTPVFGLRLISWGECEFRAEVSSYIDQRPGIDNCFHFSYNSLQLNHTNLSNTLSKRLIYKSHKSFIK